MHSPRTLPLTIVALAEALETPRPVFSFFSRPPFTGGVSAGLPVRSDDAAKVTVTLL